MSYKKAEQIISRLPNRTIEAFAVYVERHSTTKTLAEKIRNKKRSTGKQLDELIKVRSSSA